MGCTPVRCSTGLVRTGALIVCTAEAGLLHVIVLARHAGLDIVIMLNGKLSWCQPLDAAPTQLTPRELQQLCLTVADLGADSG
eukprot:CAMPEP_0206136206 /NCGR_PEP_ID=MMETSP1473-20131121/1441_1 /ASSEMBLY_ACC=CAM_ASM_001109 /TAXON_ID=1461547 /ORGANISM="Stichococcus sp, Strain RCC1054" /LENGTH=82 /DNA_ID=CAMNT_0053528563 /DNA_START=929 /DNA_END=1177 /DNA_ORIENTATION=+